MGLTRTPGPLSPHPPPEVNYEISGPARRLLFQPFPRRVRAEVAGALLADTDAGMLLHETALLPVLYVPEADLDLGLLEPTEHTTHCPYKGDAAYWSVRVGGRVVAENAVWSYPEPMPASAWLRGYYAIYWGAMDAWYDEDQPVQGHLRDPYTRVDVRRVSRPVRVLLGDEPVADSTEAKVLSETGHPNRYYLPRADVRPPLQPSETSAVCPYKGTSSYWSLEHDGSTVPDAAWSYEDPFDEVGAIAGHLCFDTDGTDALTVEVG